MEPTMEQDYNEEADHEEVELGGFEDEFANVMGFTVTALLRIVERQQVLLNVIFDSNPDLAEKFASAVDTSSSSQAATILGEWLEGCIDTDTDENSMLFQVHEQLASLAGLPYQQDA